MLSLASFRHLNLSKIRPEIITTADENMVNNLDYEGSIFPVSKKIISNWTKKNVCINVFCYENDLAYPVHTSDQKVRDCMGLLLTTNENKSHYVYIKDFNRFMRNKTNNKNIKHFCRYFLHCFSRERVLIEHKKTCLEINGKQTVKLRNNLLGFKNHFKQLFHLKFTLILNLFWKELKVMIETKRLHILKNIKIIL